MRRLTRLTAAALALAACARMAPPPGGPTSIKPPELVAAFPDSVRVMPDFRGAAEFRFNEVISEGGQPNFGRGTGDLEKLVLLSPDTTVPVVQWHRNRITVRPRKGWLPNTVYRIELLAGVTDLRQNQTKSPIVITFATGGDVPTRFLSGRVVDWSAKAFVRNALIEAFHLPDSTRYRTVADSVGRFQLGPVPSGSYLVQATIDQNRDHKRQAGEPWDTVRAAATQDTVGEIWAFARDTLPLKIQSIARQDSFAVAVTFTRPIDPYQHLDSTSLRVGLVVPGDTVTVAPLVAYPKVAFDSVFPRTPPPRTPKQDSIARRDSLARDSASRAAPRIVRRAPRGGRNAPASGVVDSVRQKRPPLGTVLVIRTQGRIELGKRYFVEVRNVRTAGGVTGPPVGRVFDTPKPPSAADSAKARADSLKSDSLRKGKPDPTGKIRPDSIKAPVPPKVKPDSAIRRR